MKTVDALTGLNWFEHVGQPISANGERSVVLVSDWGEAVAGCSGPQWQEIIIEARNELTMHLNSVCKAEFKNWNEVVNDAKHRLAEPWSRMRMKLGHEGLPQIVADCVEWDTMHAVAYEHYAAWNPPMFFEHLLTIYLSGHFPCGWIGSWPEGKLRVF